MGETFKILHNHKQEQNHTIIPVNHNITKCKKKHPESLTITTMSMPWPVN